MSEGMAMAVMVTNAILGALIGGMAVACAVTGWMSFRHRRHAHGHGAHA